MKASSSTSVQCYSGHTYAQEPRAFWQGAEHHTVERVLRRWREPVGPCFEIVSDNGARLVLAYDESTDLWDVRAQGWYLSPRDSVAANTEGIEEDGQR